MRPLPPPKSPRLHALLSGFFKNLDLLRNFVTLVSNALDSTFKPTQAEIRYLAIHAKAFALAFPDKLEDHSLPPDIESAIEGMAEFSSSTTADGKASIKITLKSPEDRKRYVEATDRSLEHIRNSQHLHRSSLISLISFTEIYIAQLIAIHLESTPAEVDQSDHPFTFEELSKFETVSDARQYLIERKIESVMRGPLETWLKHLKDKLKLSMSYLDPSKSAITEVFQRRNLLVHNDGVVNSLYLRNVPADAKHRAQTKGESAVASASYLRDAISIIQSSFPLIAAEYWKNRHPDDVTRSHLLNVQALEAINGDRFQEGKSLCEFSMRDKALPEEDRLVAQFNYWQCLKWTDSLKPELKAIDKLDLSAKHEQFHMARSILLDRTDEAIATLKRLVQSKHIALEDLKSWPIFRQLRDEPTFQEVLHSLEPKTRRNSKSRTRIKKDAPIDAASPKSPDGTKPSDDPPSRSTRNRKK